MGLIGDEQKYGGYRTRQVSFESYDAATEAMRIGLPYQTVLDPLTDDPSVTNPPITK